MKLIFGLFIIPKCPTNNGVQFFYIHTVPFRVGEHVKLIDEFSISHFGEDKRGKHYKVLEVIPRKGWEDRNILLRTTLNSNPICCSWVVPVNSIWKLISKGKQ